MPLSRLTSETHAVSCHRNFRIASTLAGPLMRNQRKEWATVGPYTLARSKMGDDKEALSNVERPESPGLHAAYNGWDNAMQRRKAKLTAQTQP